MSTLLEPPAFVSIAAVLTVGAATLFFGLKPSRSRVLPAVTSERDEAWGVDGPPPVQKRPYIYPADRPHEPDSTPLPAPRTVASLGTRGGEDIVIAEPPTDRPVAPPAPASPPEHPSRDVDLNPRIDGESDDEEELSLADLFRPKRRPPPRPRPPSAPDDAPTQD